MTRNATIGRIHQLKALTGVAEEDYRTILASCSNGKTSCRDMDDEYLNLVKQTFERLYAKQQHGLPGGNKLSREESKIAKLGILLGWSWHDIANFVKRQTEGRKISTKSCTPAELTKVINGMVELINDGLTKGTLQLAHPDLEKFLKYTQQHDSKQTAHNSKEVL